MKSPDTQSMTFALQESRLYGCFEFGFRLAEDARGSFVKTFQANAFERHGLATDFKECYYSTSRAGVLRGMHFQSPPTDHAKLIYCVHGRILDVALDLRTGSPTYGQCAKFDLQSDRQNAVYLPSGVAHGYYVCEAPATVLYHVTSEYSPSHDQGILWNSFGFDWPDPSPLISERDRRFSPLSDFESPFI